MSKLPGSSAARRWDDAHPARQPSGGRRGATAVPAHLYTDENPATTIKGTGFKNERVARRTIELTSQPGARYKQYWTVRAMRERAAHHPNPTAGMRDAVAVFDEWLENYVEPSKEEREEQRKEWEAFRELCRSDANAHSYGKDPSKEELDRARQDIAEGRRLLFELLSRFRPKSQSIFPLTSFVAVFGGPGLHGYGQHTINTETSTSQVDVDGIEGIEELIGSAKARKLTFGSSSKVQIDYDRKKESASVTVESIVGRNTLENLWSKSAKPKHSKRKRDDEDIEAEPSWTCLTCTFVHTGNAKSEYLACEVCGSQRTDTTCCEEVGHT